MTINSKPANRIKKNQIFETNYVFIDGMSRSGKIAIAPIVSCHFSVHIFLGAQEGTWVDIFILPPDGEVSCNIVDFSFKAIFHMLFE